MLFAGFFVNQDNIPWWLREFQYMSIFKYGYQALFLNEYDDLDLACMHKQGAERCDPKGQFKSPENLEVSIYSLTALYAGCYLIALLIMLSLSRKYE